MVFDPAGLEVDPPAATFLAECIAGTNDGPGCATTGGGMSSNGSCWRAIHSSRSRSFSRFRLRLAKDMVVVGWDTCLCDEYKMVYYIIGRFCCTKKSYQ